MIRMAAGQTPAAIMVFRPIWPKNVTLASFSIHVENQTIDNPLKVLGLLHSCSLTHRPSVGQIDD
jgi:hypothetical protein